MQIVGIILTVNNYALLQKALRSLVATKYFKLKLLVWDNGSDENIERNLQREFPNIDFLRSPINLGFAEGNNRAIAYALKKYNPDYFLLFNNDAVAESNLFKTCLPHLTRQMDLLSPTIVLDENRGIDNVGIDYFRSGYAHGRLEPGNRANLISGCCLFVSRRLVRKSFALFGWLFNPLYFSYAEDLELGLRARLLGAKYRVLNIPLVSHRRLATLGEKNQFRDFISWRNLLWTIITVWPRRTIFKNWPYVAWGQIVANVLYIWDGNITLFPHVYLSTLKHLPELLHMRTKISKATNMNQEIKFDEVFIGKIACWSVFLRNRKIYRIGKFLQSTYKKIFTAQSIVGIHLLSMLYDQFRQGVFQIFIP